MSNKPFRIITGIASLVFILLACIILLSDLRSYRDQSSILPEGLKVNGIPLSNLSLEEAASRLEAVFSSPVELRYKGQRMQFTPLELGYSVDVSSTFKNIDQSLSKKGYWAHLWNRSTKIDLQIPLKSSLDSTQLAAFLTDQVSARYDKQPTAPLPIPGTTNFNPGNPGTSLQVSGAIDKISAALSDPYKRVVELPVEEQNALMLNPVNLETFLNQEIRSQEFSGLVEIYLDDLTGDQDLHFANQQYQAVPPDIAFSAASTIKIPIMVSTLARIAEPTPPDVQDLLERMIVFSENPPADTLMSRYIDKDRGPLVVTADMQALGLQNTFLAGYFYTGAPVLQLFSTPANTRRDVFLDPDVYNQTVSSEIGDLLAQVYSCAEADLSSTSFSNVFGTELTQTECQNIIDLLSRNYIGLLFQGGMPAKATIAHKHGWTSELDGLLHSMSDAGIIYTPGGNFVLVISIYSPDQLVFYEGNWLFARLSQTIYNAFNIEDQAYWWIE